MMMKLLKKLQEWLDKLSLCLYNKEEGLAGKKLEKLMKLDERLGATQISIQKRIHAIVSEYPQLVITVEDALAQDK